jgi:hypothetical protein
VRHRTKATGGGALDIYRYRGLCSAIQCSLHFPCPFARPGACVRPQMPLPVLFAG